MPNSFSSYTGSFGNISTGTITISASSASYTYSTTGSYGSVLLSNGANGTNWATLSGAGANGTSWSTVASTYNPGLDVSGDANFEGDIKWKGRSLGKLLESIEDRLAILAEPDPAKLEKFAALKKAYDHYKLMEKLIGDE